MLALRPQHLQRWEKSDFRELCLHPDILLLIVVSDKRHCSLEYVLHALLQIIAQTALKSCEHARVSQ